MKKIESWKQQLEWDIADAKEEVEKYKEKVTKILKRDNNEEIAKFLPTYSQRLAEAVQKMEEAKQNLRKVELIIEENSGKDFTTIIYNRYNLDGEFIGECRYQPISQEDYDRAMEIAERLPDEYEIVNVEKGTEWRK